MSKSFNDYIQETFRKELGVNSKLSAISSIILLILYCFALTQTSDPVRMNIEFLYLLIFSLICRIIHSQFNYFFKNNWHQIFSILLFITSVFWFLFFTDILRLNVENYNVLLLTYVVVAGLSAGSASSFLISKRDFYIFQTGLFSILLFGFNQSHNKLGYRLPSTLIIILQFIYLSKQRKLRENEWLKQVLQNFELQSIIDTIPGGISVIKNGIYVKSNEYLNKIIFKEQSNKSLVGFKIGDLSQNEDDFISKIIKFSKSNEKSIKFESEILLFNQKRIHLVVAQNIERADGQETIISTIDIHDLKIAEEENKINIIKLEHSAKMASLGEMSSGLAHEINNPLAIISGRTQLIRKHLNSGQFDKLYFENGLEIIERTIGRIAKIVKGLKTFARDAEKDPFVNFKVKDIIEETISFCEARFKNYGVDFKFDILVSEADNLTLDCRPTQISQVLLNALNNSYDAIFELEDKWITLSVEKKETILIFKITDSGAGIPKDIQNKLMQPFFTTKDVGKGTGLGLSLSRGIIESHQGRFYFNFSHPTNTQLIIELPISQKK